MKNFTIKSSDLILFLGAIALGLSLTGGINGCFTPGEMMLGAIKGAFFIIVGSITGTSENNRKH